MSDLKRWTSLSLLSTDFVDNIQSCVVFGSSGSEVLMITKDDEVYGMGTNFCSCLGSPTQGSLEPTRIDYLSGRKIKQIAYGAGPHVLALSETGHVYAWGNNTHGQLGLGHTVQGTSPMAVQGLIASEKVIQIACGGHHSVAVTDRGDVFTWGMNSSGQLGIGSDVNHDTPKLVPLYNRVITNVCCGHNYTLALSQAGDVYAWGYNGNGQIGAGNMCNQLNPYHIESLSKCGPITQIVCGFAHALALSDEGHLFVWGSNSCGQLGGHLLRKNLAEPIHAAKDLGRITDIAAVHLCNVTAVMTKVGKVYMWGHLRGQTVSSPIETRFQCIDDCFACFASPAVSWRMIGFRCTKQATILDALRGAFDDANTSDMKIHVDGRVIHVHKALLRMRCQYFKTRLNGLWEENNGTDIEVHDFTYPIYRAFLHWLYTDELIVEEAQDIIALLELSNCYCEMELQNKCAILLQKAISIENAAQFYAISLKYEMSKLEDFCFRFCMNHMTAITQTESIHHVDDHSFKLLISKGSKEGVFRS